MMQHRTDEFVRRAQLRYEHEQTHPAPNGYTCVNYDDEDRTCGHVHPDIDAALAHVANIDPEGARGYWPVALPR